eukprot:TRINITY_DN8082_c0_g2_i1.p1 TRINITY_DN8082_c0_g2~~TRINITY_DN8082_c0_g2_i1.p1  ORF type:complete len:204 (-),score=64.85 TRINITY_DN8082_c0_g2_i1:165-776(-)
MESQMENLAKVQAWLDTIPFTRPRKNLARDFSDGVLVAEIMHYYFPKLVDMHCYVPLHAVEYKINNWNLLNDKVFRKLGYLIEFKDVENIANCVPGAAEKILLFLYDKIQIYIESKKPKPPTPPDPELVRLTEARNEVFALVAHLLPEQQFDALIEIALQRDDEIAQLRDQIKDRDTRIKALEQLLKTKDNRINKLQTRIDES